MKQLRTKNEITAALKSCSRYFAFAAMFSAGINLLFLAPSIFMLQLYDRVLSSSSLATLFMLLAAVLLALSTLGVLDDVRARILIRAGIRLDTMLAPRVLSALIERGVHPGGAQHGQAMRDLDNFRQFVTGPGVHAVFDAPWMPFYIMVTFMLNPILGVVAVGGAVLLVCLAIANELGTRAGLKTANQAAVKSYSTTESTLRNAEVIQAMGMQPGLMARWSRDRATVLGYQALSSDRSAFFQAAIKFSRMVLQVVMLSAGAWLVIERVITPGAMFASSIIMGRALMPIEQIVGAWRQFAAARESYNRVRDLLAAQPPRDVNKTTLPKPTGALSIERLYYALAGHEKPILKGLTFAIKPGEAVGIVGPSAAGKSTLARLLVGVWKPSAGTVRLDGADVYTWDRADFGRYIGYLPQDIELFDGTVRDNIARFTDCETEEVITAAKRAGVHDFVLHLPHGYDTNIGEAGATLSGGMRQRVGLARALFGSPRLLILDEPNSNLDSDGEQALMVALNEMKAGGTTIIIIAHRPSILGAVDRLMVLRDGSIELFGPRSEVMAKLTPNVVRPAAFAGGGAPPAPRES